jgi:hypothetical protein
MLNCSPTSQRFATDAQQISNIVSKKEGGDAHVT